MGILQPVSGADDRLGSKPAVISALGWGRFTPESSRNSDNTALTLRARTGLVHRSKFTYSITSSAIASSDGGTTRSSMRAVCILITSSNLFACTIGKSAGRCVRMLRSR